MNTFLVDLSSNQPTPYDFARLKADGVAGAMIKVSEGTYYTNELLAYATGQARSVPGFLTGFYHFAMPFASLPDAEAQYFLSRLPTLKTYDMLALDIESEPLSRPAGDLSDWALEFCNVVRKATGFLCFVYSYPDYITRRLTKPELMPYPLWLADLGDPTKPGRPGCGPWNHTVLRQYSFITRHAGIANGGVDCDESIFYGTTAELQKYGKPAPAPPPPVEHYPYTSNAAVRADLKAAMLTGPFAGKPTHGSNPAIDEHHRYVTVELGGDLIVTGPVIHTDDDWRPCNLPPPSNVQGWFLDRNLKPDS